jgi:hypothetical protein
MFNLIKGVLMVVITAITIFYTVYSIAVVVEKFL